MMIKKGKLKCLVSACLAGVKCRYNGKDCKNLQLYRMVRECKALPFCPELLSGLPTPRKPSQVIYRSGKRKVVSLYGENLSNIFQKGAILSYNLAKRFGIDSAYLKRRSPSCGFDSYRGKDEKSGITAAYFFKKGIKVFSR